MQICHDQSSTNGLHSACIMAESLHPTSTGLLASLLVLWPPVLPEGTGKVSCAAGSSYTCQLYRTWPENVLDLLINVTENHH